ncbi:MAG: nuclear transport factor 2 family protein [Chitinophagaceae bacterium]|nr:nuclear transport factor 2 family protein [Chitinophagaceae bacterium]
MNDNRTVVERFYTAFQRLNAPEMNGLYSSNGIIYSNPVYGLLNNDEVHCMWALFCSSVKDFSFSFSDIELLDEEYTTCRWNLSYTILQTGRKVNMRAKSFMRLSEGRIIEHSDAFRLSTFIGQAYGWTGWLFGWTGFLKKKAQLKARKSLVEYIGNVET